MDPTHPWCLEGPGARPSRNWKALQNALLLSVRVLWMGRGVSQMEEALEVQLNRRALCCCARFKRLPPPWSAVIDRRQLAAVAREVSFWARGTTWRRHTRSTTPMLYRHIYTIQISGTSLPKITGTPSDPHELNITLRSVAWQYVLFQPVHNSVAWVPTAAVALAAVAAMYVWVRRSLQRPYVNGIL